MSLRKPELVLFDLDGTLVDTAPDLAWAVDAMLREMGLPARGEDKVRGWVGNGIERLVKRALTDDFDGEPDPGLYERGFERFMGLYSENTCVKSQVYPGVFEAIDYLKLHDCKIACVTNKREQFTIRVLKTVGLYSEFGIVVSGDTLTHKKPDPRPLLHTVDFFNCLPQHALMIGDSVTDIRAAANAGLQMLYVTYGYNQGKSIQKLPVDASVDSLLELPELLQA